MPLLTLIQKVFLSVEGYDFIQRPDPPITSFKNKLYDYTRYNVEAGKYFM